MTKLTVENVYTSHKAKELTKKHFWKLLGMMAIAFGIPFVLPTITTVFIPTDSASTYGLVLILLDDGGGDGVGQSQQNGHNGADGDQHKGTLYRLFHAFLPPTPKTLRFVQELI